MAANMLSVLLFIVIKASSVVRMSSGLKSWEAVSELQFTTRGFIKSSFVIQKLAPEGVGCATIGQLAQCMQEDNMDEDLAVAIKKVNYARYLPGQKSGHYESFFQRANHPSQPLAFWIRYTIFSPNGHPENAIGELWSVYFDGITGHHVAVKKEVLFRRCTFKNSEFYVQVDDAVLQPGSLKGSATSGAHAISWELAFGGGMETLFMLPLKMYQTSFPKAKMLVGTPMAKYSGTITVDGKKIVVENWVGSQNHNWGSKHTDLYAWGQVAGFDNSPESFLEVATARLKVGPLWTPPMTPLVLRHKGKEYALNTLRQTLGAIGWFNYFEWKFSSETRGVRIEGRISAPKTSFVGLNYYNPPGGSKHCLNSKIAACELSLTHKQPGGTCATELLYTRNRAAFEILTDDRSHGIQIMV